MPLPINISELLNGQTVECDRLELKTGWNPEAVLHTICAFANDINNWGGGYIVIGVEEKDGLPVLPPVGLKQNELDTIQKKLIEIRKSHKRFYIRRGSKTVQANTTEEIELIRLAAKILECWFIVL